MKTHKQRRGELKKLRDISLLDPFGPLSSAVEQGMQAGQEGTEQDEGPGTEGENEIAGAATTGLVMSLLESADGPPPSRREIEHQNAEEFESGSEEVGGDEDIPASPITMMSEAGRRNAIKAGQQIDYRTGMIRRQS